MYEMMQMKREEKEHLTEATATYVDTIVGRANVTYTHLLNLKRVAYATPSRLRKSSY